MYNFNAPTPCAQIRNLRPSLRYPRPAQIGKFIAAAAAAADAADAALVFQIREREILTIDQTKLNMF